MLRAVRCLRPVDRRAQAVVILLAGGAALAACGGGHKASAPTTFAPVPAPTTTSSSTSTTKPPKIVPGTPVAPLTGRPEPTAAATGAVAVVVKIDNVDDARPQTGIGRADVVYEEEVEGGLTRLAAIFQSQYPTTVGPIRSGRTTDLGIIDDLDHPVYAYSGSNLLFQPILESAPVYAVNADNHGGLFAREGSRAAPHNLYSSVAALAGVAGPKGTPPAPLFSYLPAGTAFGGAGIGTLTAAQLNFPAASVHWTWDPTSGTWQRTQNGTRDFDSTGARLGASNVVIQSTAYSTDGFATGEGLAQATPIPKGQLVGTGTVWIMSAGKVVQGTWTRAGLTTGTTYTDSARHPIRITPGITWVELLPAGTAPVFTP